MKINDWMEYSLVKFGTSGARGLVKDMTDKVCYTYTAAFLQYLKSIEELAEGASVAVAGDYRPSTPRILAAVMQAIEDFGCVPVHCGYIPSPAVALYGFTHGIPSIMVTGSHIPDDRNGIKFNKTSGEILKQDEAAIREIDMPWENAMFDTSGSFVTPPTPSKWTIIPEAAQEYKNRYLNFFSRDALSNLRIGVYQHSAVGRDILAEIVNELGGTAIPLGRSNRFIPVDTEALRPEDVELAKQWVKEYELDAIFSTDGDSDRPLLATEKGEWIRGDVGGILTAHFLHADAIVLSVSCNTAAEKSNFFGTVLRTRIGSPYVIAEINQLIKRQEVPSVICGYEANGGFLVGTDIDRNGRCLKALPTRDALIYLLSITMMAQEEQKSLSTLLQELPKRYTYSDRLQNVPPDVSAEILNAIISVPESERLENVTRVYRNLSGEASAIDVTDGVRMIFSNEEIIHLRPSGNAPEFRCYTEAETEDRARELNSVVMAKIKLSVQA